MFGLPDALAITEFFAFVGAARGAAGEIVPGQSSACARIFAVVNELDCGGLAELPVDAFVLPGVGYFPAEAHVFLWKHGQVTGDTVHVFALTSVAWHFKAFERPLKCAHGISVDVVDFANLH